MCIPTFVDFFLFHLFFSLFLSFSFSFLSVSPVAGPYGIFFLLFPFVCQLPSIPSSDHFQFFFHQVTAPFFHLVTAPFVTLRPHPHTHSSSFRTFSLLGRPVINQWLRGQHTFLYRYTRIRSGGQEKIKQTNKHEQRLGLTKSKKELLQHYMHVRTIVSVGYQQKFHKHLECRHLESIFFTGPYLVSSCLRSPVLTAPVCGSTPTLFAVPTPTLWCPVALPSSRQLPLSSFSSQLSFASPSHFRIQRDFMSKNPSSDFAPKQTKESSALAAHPHSATSRLLLCQIRTGY